MVDPYLYPGTDVLKNIADIRDSAILQELEADLTLSWLADLGSNKSASFFNFEALCEIHHYIFQDIFEWAGKIRIINIEKPERALGGISIEYSDCFDIQKDTEQAINDMKQLTGKIAMKMTLRKHLASAWLLYGVRIHSEKETPGQL